ncbi:MAG TPA: hypothetical protein DD641_02690, partial [Deltaproteobacteria bacterium]|nr:hypothetical protein [Deltaproteobacteria bacterium]
SLSDDDRNCIETHLIMDPSFNTAIEFLSTIAATFGIPVSGGGQTEWQIKENIKNYLFSKGVGEGKLVVLIIDEGQKLPDFCLESLREFLNYETNNFKLLQIVIFAQKEFVQALKNRKNFADRVNQYYFLKPLNLRETRHIVKFRIAKASDVETPPPLFTYYGLLAVYLATGGYPRKIVSLCHNVVLALIIQNRSRAGWFLVRSCANKVLLNQPVLMRKVQWGTAALASTLFTLLVAAAFNSDLAAIIKPRKSGLPEAVTVKTQIPHEDVNSNPLTDTASVSDVTEHNNNDAIRTEKSQMQEPSESPSMISSNAAVHSEKVPETLGQLTADKGTTVWWRFSRIYGDFDLEQFKAVADANPHIKDLNKIQVGEKINFPALPSIHNPLQTGKYWVKITSRDNLEEAYKFFKSYPNNLPQIRFFPYWNNSDGLIFAVLLKDGFPDEASALNAIKHLPPQIDSSASVVNRWKENTVFFSR